MANTNYSVQEALNIILDVNKKALRSRAARDTLYHGRNSDIDTSAEQLTSTDIPATNGVLIKAANDNSGTIYVGNSDATINSNDDTDGFELGGGESIFVEIDNANKVYLIASEEDQVVYYLVT